jgi:hypothetical protein
VGTTTEVVSPIGNGTKIETSSFVVCVPRLAIGHIASRDRLRMDEGNRGSGDDQGKQEKRSENLCHVCSFLQLAG